MTSASRNDKSSICRSMSVPKDSSVNNVNEENEDQHFSDYSANPKEDDTMVEREMETTYNRKEFSKREVLKAKLKYHFMNPWQKYKARRRRPWKLVIQIFKIFIVTIQIALFGTDRFSVVQFSEENLQALKNLFLKDYNGNSTVLYTKEQVFSYLYFAHEKYYDVQNAVGSYDYPNTDNNGNPPRVVLCYEHYKNFSLDSSDRVLVFVPDIISECMSLPKPLNDVHILKNDSFQFGLLLHLNMSFTLNAINLKGVRSWDKPSCYSLDVLIKFDNTKLDGQMPITLDMTTHWLKCRDNSMIKTDNEEVGYLITIGFLVFDAIVIFTCTLSLILCLRSLFKSYCLAKEAKCYFLEERQDVLTQSDLMALFNLWFMVIILSDVLTILGSTYKIAIEQKDGDYYDVCSVLFGVAVLLVWCGLLRFLQYFKQYNALLVTLKAACPSVLRFCLCCGVLFVGFTLCGWIVLGPYHPKFRDTTVTAECLFSLVNGDDMYNTYILTNPKHQAIWVYSKLYLYTFIALFIYVVLSLFIGIIGDTYERLKDMGHLPATKLQRFLEEEPGETGNTDQGPLRVNNAVVLESSTTSNVSMYRNMSLDSTGVE